MSLTKIYSAFQKHISQAKIDLYSAANSEQALSDLKAALTLLQINKTFDVTDAVLSHPANAVIVVGQAKYAIPEDAGRPQTHVNDVKVMVKATLVSQSNTVVFELELALPERNWTFSKMFKKLPQSKTLDPNGQSVSIGPSVLNDLLILKPLLSARSLPNASAQLSGLLPDDGVFANKDYSGLFPGLWPLALSGDITLPENLEKEPDMLLAAIASGSQLAFGKSKVTELGFEISSTTGFKKTDMGASSLCSIGLTGTVNFGPTHKLQLYLSLLASNQTWRLLALAEPKKLKIGEQISNLAAILGLESEDLMSPETLGTLDDFYLSEIEIWLPAFKGSLLKGVPASVFKINNIAVTIRSDKEWDPPIPFVKIVDVGTRWVISLNTIVGSQTGSLLSGSVFGGFKVGKKDNLKKPLTARRGQSRTIDHDTFEDINVSGISTDSDLVASPPPTSFTVDVNALIPQFVIAGRLRSGDEIPIGYAFKQFFGDTGPPTENDMKITKFAFQADPLEKTFSANAVISTKSWSIDFTDTVSLRLVEMDFSIDVSQSQVGGSIAGTLELKGAGTVAPKFTVSAAYPIGQSVREWTFKGDLHQNSVIELDVLVNNLISPQKKIPLPKLSITEMSIEFKSKSRAYHVQGTVAARWTPDIFDGADSLTISAKASAEIRRIDAKSQPFGSVTGSFFINKIGASISRQIGVAEPSYTFKVMFGEHYLTAQTSWAGSLKKRHQVISIQLSSVTIGEILEYLVSLAAPTLGYSLSAPWDVLNRIDLSKFKLVIDPKEQTVSLTYEVDVNLVLIQIDRIGVKYLRKKGDGTVEMIVEGKTLSEDYTGDNALSWDVVNDSPPSLAKSDNNIVDLRYLAFGQHVSVDGLGPLNTVRSILDHMEKEMQPVDDQQSPLGQSGANGVKFDADSEWLIGLDVKLAGMVDLGVIFNDPRIYGLAIALSGENSGSLKGLVFEILYKKITDKIGMYRIELVLPDEFRHLEFGEISVTLGTIVIEIYTNGNFKVDFGFPYKRSFERSFSVEVFPFLGRGGIYFGLLNGNTSSRVPTISNGSFDPVIELGVGLAVGVGKDFSVGPLSAGAYVELEVIFQGVLGFFNPHNAALDHSFYYWVQGLAAIHGKIYGKVDFKVIKVSVTLEASATATLTLEAHEPTLVDLNVDVSARATVKILFVHVHFSFHVSVDISFTIGKKTATPWIVGDHAGGVSNTIRAMHVQSLHRISRPHPGLKHAHLMAAHFMDLHAAGIFENIPNMFEHIDLVSAMPASLNWDANYKVYANSPRPLPLFLLPSFTCEDMPLGWSNTPPTSATEFRISMQLFADTGAGAVVKNIADNYQRDVKLSAHASNIKELPAAQIVETFLRWAIHAVVSPVGGGTSTKITAAQLTLLAKEMENGASTKAAFEYANLQKFIATNLKFNISGVPASGTPKAIGAMVIAPPPELIWTWTGETGGRLSLAEHNLVGESYIAGVANYQNAFTPGSEPIPEPDDKGQGYSSIASHQFDDWCLMVTKTAVEEAQKSLKSWSLRPNIVTDLETIANTFPVKSVNYDIRGRDTVESVAHVLGVSPDELKYLNPNLFNTLKSAKVGTSIKIDIGISPEAIALDNLDRTLQVGKFNLGNVVYQIKADDTLKTIATKFGLSATIDLLTGTSLANQPSVLLPGATFTTHVTRYTPPSNSNALKCAAMLYSHLFDTSKVPNRQSFADRISLWNPEPFKQLHTGQALPQGTDLFVPNSLDDMEKPKLKNYKTVSGDTLLSISAASDLEHSFAIGTTAEIPGWAKFRTEIAASFAKPGGPELKSMQIRIQPGETLDELAARTFIFGPAQAGGAPDLKGLFVWLENAKNLLTPLTSITIPSVLLDTSKHKTFSAISSDLDLEISSIAQRLKSKNIIPILKAKEKSWVVSNVPIIDIEQLVHVVLSGDAVTHVTARSARQVLSGTRLPAPKSDGKNTKRATGDLTPMSTLTGQQFVGPAPPRKKAISKKQLTNERSKTNADPLALRIVVTKTVQAKWINFVDTTVVKANDTLSSLSSRAPQMRDYNASLTSTAISGPDGELPFTQGTILHANTAANLIYSFKKSELKDSYPAPNVTITAPIGPAAAKLSLSVPVTHGLDHRIELQTQTPLQMPNHRSVPKAGNPSLWPFSADIQALAALHASTPYEIVKSKPKGVVTAQEETLLDATFGSLISIKIKQISEKDHLYSLLGSNDVDRQILLHLWQYLKAAPTPAPSLSIMVNPDPAAKNIHGLQQFLFRSTHSFVVKTNLSTESVPGLPDVNHNSLMAMATLPSAALFAAGLDDPASFLTLLWEGTTVGGSGYILNLQDKDKKGLPTSIFDGQGEAVIQILVITGDQQGAAPNGRSIHSCNNCALVAAGLDAAVHSVYMEAADDSKHKLISVVPPGNVGVDLLVPMPANPPVSKNDFARDLFSIANYRVGKPGDMYYAKHGGMPMLPKPTDQANLNALDVKKLHRQARAKRQVAPIRVQDHWYYHQIFPVAKMGPAAKSPSIRGLPNALNDPYCGISNSGTLNQAAVEVGFNDVFGNTTKAGLSKQTKGHVEINVGYTDVLIPLENWPALSRSYNFKTGSSVNLVGVHLSMASQANVLAPGLNETPNQSIVRAEKQAEKYQQIYYQMAQPNNAVFVNTSLNTDVHKNTIDVKIPDGDQLLWRFAGANYLSSIAASKMLPEKPLATKGMTLKQLENVYGLSPSHLSKGVEDVAARSILGPNPIPVSAYVTWSVNMTADTLVKNLAPGWPVPKSAISVLSNPKNANSLPLKAGAHVVKPNIPIRAPAVGVNVTLEAFANEHGTTAVLLAEGNAGDVDLLTAGVDIELDDQVIRTDAVGAANGIRSFDQIVSAFKKIGIIVEVPDVALAIANRDTILLPAKSWKSTVYVVPEPTIKHPHETLAHNGSGASVADLAKLNTSTKGLFDTGALLYVGLFSPAPTIAPTNTQTLSQFCDTYSTTPARLFEDLAVLTPAFNLPVSNKFVVSGMVQLPSDVSQISTPYSILAGDTLNTIVEKFAYPSHSNAAYNLATQNENMPGIFIEGKRISAGGASTSTLSSDSINSIFMRMKAQTPNISLRDIITAVGGTANLLRPGGLLSCAVAKLKERVGSANLRPTDIEADYGVSASSFAQLNAGLKGLIVGNTKLSSGGANSVDVITKINDTLNSIVSRIVAKKDHKNFDINALILANPNVALFQKNAKCILPPTKQKFSIDIPSLAGPFSRPNTPLTVSLFVKRPLALLDPEFKPISDANPIISFTSVFNAPITPGEKNETSKFGETFLKFFPNLRLTSGKVEGSNSELWFVDFGDSGIKKLTLSKPVTATSGTIPRYFALRPLYSRLVTLSNVTLPKISDAGVVTHPNKQNIVAQRKGVIKQAVVSKNNELVSVDIETWGRRVLADIDTFLSTDYVNGLYANTSSRPHLLKVLAAKAILQNAVAGGLAPILQIDDPGVDNALTSAVVEVEQVLGRNLSAGNNVSVVVQYASNCDSVWSAIRTKELPARLSGDINKPASTVAKKENYSITSAKTDVAAINSYVNFVTTLNNNSHSTEFSITPEYEFTHIEVDIQHVEVGTHTKYDASNWLAFEPPLVKSNKTNTSNFPTAITANLGEVKAPIPMRAFPKVPTLRGQSAEFGDMSSLHKAGVWNYTMRYQHEHAAQDDVFVSASFNVKNGVSQPMLNGPTDELAEKLAYYNHVADELWNFLSYYNDPTAGTIGSATNAADGFAWLVSEVAASWLLHWQNQPLANVALSPEEALLTGAGLMSETYTYDIEVKTAQQPSGEFDVTDIILTQVQAAVNSAMQWPSVYLHQSDGDTIEAIRQTTPKGAKAARYKLPKPVVKSTYVDLSLAWHEIQISKYQNAQASLHVERNGKLSELAPTNPEFIFTSDKVTAPSLVTPIGSTSDRFIISKPNVDFASALTGAFKELFGPNYIDQSVTIEVLYGFELVSSQGGIGDELISYLPVALYPNQKLSSSTGVTLDSAVTAWMSANNPSRQGGELVISLKLYSQLTLKKAQTLLSIDNLVYKLS